MKSIQLLITAAVFTMLTTTGCSQPNSETSAEQNKVAPPAAAPVGLDAPLAADDIDLALKVLAGPTYNAANDTVTYQIEAENKGQAMLVSAGSLPVHLGVVIRGADGTMATPPATLDFMRIQFPNPLEPGQRVALPVEFQAASTLGGTVVVDAVQEQVHWFSDYNKPVLVLGKFKRCNEAQNTLCLEDGTQVPAAR